MQHAKKYSCFELPACDQLLEVPTLPLITPTSPQLILSLHRRHINIRHANIIIASKLLAYHLTAFICINHLHSIAEHSPAFIRKRNACREVFSHILSRYLLISHFHTFHTSDCRYGNLEPLSVATLPYLPYFPYINTYTHTRVRVRAHMCVCACGRAGMEGMEGMENPLSMRLSGFHTSRMRYGRYGSHDA